MTTRMSSNALPARTQHLRGYLYIGGAALLWGVSATLGRAVFTGRLAPSGEALRPIDPLILAQSRTTVSFLVLLPILLLRRGPRRLVLPARDLLLAALLGILGVAGSNYFYYLAIQRTNVATAIIIQYTAPVWVLLAMILRRRQRPTWSRLAAVLLAVAGSAMAIGAVGPTALRLDHLGVAAALVAAFTFAFYNIGGHEILRRHERWTVLLATLGSAAAFWSVVNPPWRIAAAHYGRGQWFFMLVFAIASLLLPFSLYFVGLQRLDATRAIVASCLEPVFSIVIAALALGEAVRPLQAVGILVVLGAIVLVQLPDRLARGEAAPIEPIE